MEQMTPNPIIGEKVRSTGKNYFQAIALVAIIPIVFSLSCNRESIIADETFTYPDGNLPGNWWSEGCPAIIKDGHLFVDADTSYCQMSTVWMDKEFGGDFIVEYDVRIISSEGRKNNINCFLLYSDPEGKAIRETSNERLNGEYKKYHQLNGYIFTYLADGDEENARFRFRENPGFRLLEEHFGYHCRAGNTYHIQLVKQGNQFQFWVDGIKMLDKTLDPDSTISEKGLFGFRTWHTCLWWDNLVIKKLEK